MKSIFIFLIISVPVLFLNAQQEQALKLSGKVADKVIADTRFEWKLTMQKDILGMQVLDFRFLNLSPGTKALALNRIEVRNDTTVRFGISAAGKIRIWVNQLACFEQVQSVSSIPKEGAYNRFTFDQYFNLGLKKGNNEIIIEYEPGSYLPVIFLRPVTISGDADVSVVFNNTDVSRWIYAGPLSSIQQAFPIQPYYMQKLAFINWQTAPIKLLPELVVDSNAAYKRDPYSNWQYSHGTLIWSILALQQETGTPVYLSYGKKYTQFIQKHLNHLEWQYDSLFAWRGSYHRIFRRSMLDDAGAPALPFVQLYMLEKDSAVKKFLQSFTSYIFNNQLRLPDGTFCRPEPEEFTVWADDLFMSVPYLIRIAKATGETQYMEDAVRQVLRFRKYLLNAETGLYKHGWFSRSGQPSVAYWGRANGWVAWATAELLDWLPATHSSYKQVLQAFVAHINSLSKYQDENGFWHQVITRPDSYTETSCTAMFALAMARGVRKGWLKKSFKTNALKAWNAVASRIDSNGVVSGICRGTEIGFDEQFYMDRKTIDNDPRGLGAVITAGIEINKMP